MGIAKYSSTKLCVLCQRNWDMKSPGASSWWPGGGLNLTHSEARERSMTRYGEAAGHSPRRSRCFRWRPARSRRGLGEETFTGSSGRIFPVRSRSSLLLRLARPADASVTMRTRTDRFQFGASFAEGGFTRPCRRARSKADACAIGGASWPRLGSNGVIDDRRRGVEVAPLRPTNRNAVVGDLHCASPGSSLSVAIRFGDRVPPARRWSPPTGSRAERSRALRAAARGSPPTPGRSPMRSTRSDERRRASPLLARGRKGDS